MLKRIYAVFHARNLEFVRDRGTLGWNILLPFVLMLGLAFMIAVSKLFPLTWMLDSARAIMLDGATLSQVAPDLAVLGTMSALFLAAGAAIFRWRPT